MDRNKKSKSMFVPGTSNRQRAKTSGMMKFFGKEKAARPVSTALPKTRDLTLRGEKKKATQMADGAGGSETSQQAHPSLKFIQQKTAMLESDADYLLQIYECLAAQTETSAKAADDGCQLARVLSEFCTSRKSEKKLSNYAECLLMVATLQRGIEDSKQQLGNVLFEVLAVPAKQFVEADINNAMIMREEFERLDSTHEAALHKVTKQKGAKAKAMIEYNTIRFRYERMREETAALMKDTVKKEEIDNLERLCNYVDAYNDYFQSGLQAMNQVMPQVTHYRQVIKKQREKQIRDKEEKVRQEIERQQLLKDEQKKWQQERMEREEAMAAMRARGEEVDNGKIFGVSLDVLMKREGKKPPQIPSVLEKMLKYLEEKGLTQLGLFRVAGGPADMKNLMLDIDSGKDVDFEKWTDVHTVAGVCKKLLRALPEPLLTFELWDDFTLAVHDGDPIAASTGMGGPSDIPSPRGRAHTATEGVLPSPSSKRSIEREAERVATIKRVVERLPPNNYSVARRIIEFCVKVAARSDVNRMPSSNLAALIGPNIAYPRISDDASLLRDLNNANTLVQIMIDHFYDIFDRVTLSEEDDINENEEDDSGSDREGDSDASSARGDKKKADGEAEERANTHRSRHSKKRGGESKAGRKEEEGSDDEETTSENGSLMEDDDVDEEWAQSKAAILRLKQARDKFKREKEQKEKEREQKEKEASSPPPKEDSDGGAGSGSSGSSSSGKKSSRSSEDGSKKERDGGSGKRKGGRRRRHTTSKSIDNSTVANPSGVDEAELLGTSPSSQEDPLGGRDNDGADASASSTNLLTGSDKHVRTVVIGPPDEDEWWYNNNSSNAHKKRLSSSFSRKIIPRRKEGDTRRSSCLISLTLENENELEKAMAETFATASFSGWVLVGYVKDSVSVLTFQGSGKGGVDELVQNLHEDQVQFALLRIAVWKESGASGGEGEISKTTRDIFIGWIGPRVGIVQKGKKKSHMGEVKDLLKPFHAELFALRKTNFTEEVVRAKSGPLSGSHMID
ncbi:Rho GTPase-activating protein 17 [Balamuthia mandrillaris]